MPSTTLTEGMVRQILSAESSPSRFESFCIALYKRVDSHVYVPTSYNYDRGRDARATDASMGEPSPIICASLRQDVLNKAQEDAESLFRHASPKFVRFCSNQPLTEKVADKVEAIFRSASDVVETVIVDGLIQIVPLACQYPATVEQYYSGEAANLRQALAVEAVDAETVQLTGMRIALTTQLSEDAATLREDILHNLVLTALADGAPCNLASLAKRTSDLLHLPRAIQAAYLQSSLEDLSQSDLIRQDDKGRYTVTPNGKSELRNRTETGTARFTEGQQAVRRALEELCGDSPDSHQFARLWNVFQDRIANMFLANGIYITDSVASIIGGRSTLSDHPDLQQQIDDLAERVAQLGIWGGRGPDIQQAICDMFQDRTSEAFRWLSDLCMVYVSVCSLGLDRNAQDQVTARLRELDLILDTDVVLSFLSKGEPLHEAIVAVINGWKRITGSVYVSLPVLEETAYHAWIAQRDYEQVWRRLSSMDTRDALRLINNAFVRGFRIEADGRHEPKRWRYFIGQFRGQHEYDYSKLVPLLKEDGISLLPEEAIDQQFAGEVSKHLLNARNSGSDDSAEPSQEYKDKCKRDGRLVSLLRTHRRRRAEITGSAVIVSSSGLLRNACSSFASELGAPEAVVPVGAAAYLLTLAPGVNLSLGALRGVLFDVDYRAKLPPIERLVMRILDASEEYMLPFSRRASLRPIMREKINLLAKQRGQKAWEIVKQAESGDESIIQDFAGAVAAAVDVIARSEAEQEVERLRKRERR